MELKILGQLIEVLDKINFFLFLKLLNLRYYGFHLNLSGKETDLDPKNMFIYPMCYFKLIFT